MPKKKKATKGKGKAKPKKDDKDKKPARPTRCGPEFKWQQRPKLVEAAATNNAIRAQKLVARGEDASSALHYAVGRGKLETVQALLASGADIHTEIRPGDYWVPPAAAPPSEKKAKGKGSKKKGGSKKKKSKKK